MRGMSGPQLVRLSGLPARWTVSRVELAGRDITDTPIVFNREMPATGVYILITDRVTEIAGSVLDASGGIAHDYTALVFSAEPGYWTYPSRFVRAARPALDGTFSVTALPRGAIWRLRLRASPKAPGRKPHSSNRFDREPSHSHSGTANDAPSSCDSPPFRRHPTRPARIGPPEP